ncbi:MAG: glycerol-3-phosphate 1-O-acyltransferase PlsY [Dehalococcoidales bacterium]|nr:glycerol-3-phosphate 1-O-acyltransferase PlsY [Dehalococcoidales bacterium]
MTAGLYIAVVAIGYLIGSIPFGLLISQAFAKKDIRQVGSGKIGTTNVMRAAGKKAAALSLILDVGKGVLAVTLAGLIFSDYSTASTGGFAWLESAKVLAALSAIAGHSWSVFLKFKGGRGVATFLGGLLALYWPAAVVGALFMIGIGFRTRYMSLGSIIGAVTAFIMLTAFNLLRIDFLQPYPPFEYVTYAMICAVFIYVMHRDNIIRLVSGTERRIGEEAKVGTSPSSNKP